MCHRGVSGGHFVVDPSIAMTRVAPVLWKPPDGPSPAPSVAPRGSF